MSDTEKNHNLKDQIKDYIPDVRFKKSGYEIRCQLLEMAQTQVWNDFHAKYGQWEISVKKNKAGQAVTKVSLPETPTTDNVLESAEKFYAFVNQKTA